VDYTVPVEELRAELQRIASSSPQWDGKVCGLQVTNLSERTMELRCLVSSADSGKNFDLRCLIREQMIAYIRKNYPNAFPTTRFAAVSEIAVGLQQPVSGEMQPVPAAKTEQGDGHR
jgi:hypothetical protein